MHIDFADDIYRKVKQILLKSPLLFFNEQNGSGHLQHLIIRTSDQEQKVLIGIIGITPLNDEIKKLAKEVCAIPKVKGVVYGYKKEAKNSLYPDKQYLLEGSERLKETILGIEVSISLLSFFQVNKRCAEKLYQKAFELGQLSKEDKILDAYCGIGTFAIFLAKKGFDVTGIESFEKAIIDGKQNAASNGVEVDFIHGEVEKKLSQLSMFSVIFINPPRKGIHLDVVNAIIKINPKKIIYTSCNPSTLARDIALFAEHGYQLVVAYPFDMFSQTMHVETVCLLQKYR